MGKRKPDAGNYTNLLTLRENEETNTQGTVTLTATDLATLWCSLRPVRGREYYDSRIIQSNVTHIARTWWRSDVSPTSAMHLYFEDEDRTFEIESVIDIDEAHAEWEFRLTEAV